MHVSEHPPLVSYGVELVESAERAGVTARPTGALAVYLHCPNQRDLHKKMERTLTDVDLVAYQRDKNQFQRFLKGLGYQEESHLAPAVFQNRDIFHGPDRMHVDIFYDKVEMYHTIQFQGRLEADRPTIPLAELVLQKMQIIHINTKDIKDTMLLFSEHDIAGHD